MHDELGTRMKEQYEYRTRYKLPRRSYTIIRIDGKAFHNFTRGFDKPFSEILMYLMDNTAIALVQEIEGSKFAYVQSDEISILLTDFETNQTQAWFDGNIQKIASISASIATKAFHSMNHSACFDSRVFTIPDPVEVENYFIWRQQDAVRNSIQMAGQANFSHNRLQNLSCNEIQELLFQEKQINWNDYPVRYKRGAAIVPVQVEKPVIYLDKRINELVETPSVIRRKWQIVDPPTFTIDRSWLQQYIPRRG